MTPDEINRMFTDARRRMPPPPASAGVAYGLAAACFIVSVVGIVATAYVMLFHAPH